MDEIIARNMLSWLKFLIKLSLFYLVRRLYYCINDARSYKHQIYLGFTLSDTRGVLIYKFHTNIKFIRDLLCQILDVCQYINFERQRLKCLLFAQANTRRFFQYINKPIHVPACQYRNKKFQQKRSQWDYLKTIHKCTMRTAVVGRLREFCVNFWRRICNVVSNQYVIGWALSNDLNWGSWLAFLVTGISKRHNKMIPLQARCGL